MRYLRFAGVAYDARIQDALDILISKQQKDKTWPLQARHAGKTHFEIEIAGKSSRWNTLRALRVLNCFGLTEGIKQLRITSQGKWHLSTMKSRVKRFW
mgnify:CR=1 FL=1